jgi:hypothetical protein
VSKSYLVRAAITPAERVKLRLDAIRAGVPQQQRNAEVIRAGMAALDGRGKK